MTAACLAVQISSCEGDLTHGSGPEEEFPEHGSEFGSEFEHDDLAHVVIAMGSMGLELDKEK